MPRKKAVKKVTKATPKEKVATKVKFQLKDIFNYSIVGSNNPIEQQLKCYYTKCMRGIKNTKGKIVEMDATLFLKNIGNTKEAIRNPYFPPNVKYALPYIDVTRKKSRGAGRVRLCLENGITKVPVFVCGLDNDVSEWLKKG